MADKDKFIKPELKTYSAKKLLTQDRLMNAMIGIREIQTQLWKRCRMISMKSWNRN